MNRAPLIKSSTSKPHDLRRVTAMALTEAAAQVARDAGLDPAGPEMQALMRLSRDVVERVVWEVVPELAESIIRENLQQLTAKTN